MKFLLMAGVSAVAVLAGSASATVTFSYSGSVVEWTAPKTGEYMIDVFGAQGGYVYAFQQGRGVGLGGEFHLTVGETLEIAVGGAGGGGITGGGGGGSFVANAAGIPLIVAGGGGGDGFNGAPGYDATVATGNGQGGAGNDGGGGGGFYSKGGNGYCVPLRIYAQVYTNFGGGDFPGLAGGAGFYASGGFGGGGGGGYNMGGGGGGFGGGAAGHGGSSFNAGTDRIDLGYRNGDGLVTISAVPEPSTWTMMFSGLGFLGYVLRRRVTRRA